MFGRIREAVASSAMPAVKAALLEPVLRGLAACLSIALFAESDPSFMEMFTGELTSCQFSCQVTCTVHKDIRSLCANLLLCYSTADWPYAAGSFCACIRCQIEDCTSYL